MAGREKRKRNSRLIPVSNYTSGRDYVVDEMVLEMIPKINVFAIPRASGCQFARSGAFRGRRES